MLNVLITIDTEVYPLTPDWRNDNLEKDCSRDIYGVTTGGSYGLTYQLETFTKFGLKAVFFVEGLFASAVGIDRLRAIVQPILTAGHEVQLHLHPEWLQWMDDPPVQPRNRELIHQFTVDEQAELIRIGIQNLRAAGVNDVIAFRAGDGAANKDTLTALARNGISYDSSASPQLVQSYCDRPEYQVLTQPLSVGEVIIVPISYWRTWPLGSRHAQFTSASAAELESALAKAARYDWYTFVILSHSFELLNRRRERVAEPRADQIVVRRFEKICNFLSDGRDRFRTCGFADLSSNQCGTIAQKTAISSTVSRTVRRLTEQIIRRF